MKTSGTKQQKHKSATNPARVSEEAERSGLQGQDGWANIWGAVLAVSLACARAGAPRVRTAGRSGGAAVALAASKPYIIPTWPDFKASAPGFCASSERLVALVGLRIARARRPPARCISSACGGRCLSLARMSLSSAAVALDRPAAPWPSRPRRTPRAAWPCSASRRASQGCGPWSWRLAVQPGEQRRRSGAGSSHSRWWSSWLSVPRPRHRTTGSAGARVAAVRSAGRARPAERRAPGRRCAAAA